MKPLYSLLDVIRDTVKAVIMRPIASLLNTVSGGRVTPDMVTLVSVGMHVVIAWLIANGDFGLAAILLAVFGLFDALDGELARLQGKAGPSGMLLDSVTDRMKEILLYIGIAYYFVDASKASYAVWAVAACGSSLLTSYVNAWSEVAISRTGSSGHQVNRTFRGSLMRFEIRIFLLVVGLAIHQPEVVVVIIAILSGLTAVERLIQARQRL